MNSVTQDMKYRQSLMMYSKKYGVSKASRKYNKSRSYIYFWLMRYDGSIESLVCRSRRPHYHPNQHTAEELKLIQDMRRRNPKLGMIELWHRLRKRNYTRCPESLFRVMRKLGLFPKSKVKKSYIPKPYEQMQYPGQRIQIDVKRVPTACLTSSLEGNKFYQYTAIDEYSRLRYLEAFKEKSTHSSATFLLNTLAFFEKHGFFVECVQTDNGAEFTNRFVPNATKKISLFERTTQQLGIKHKLIRPFTPRHNGKVERSHREDNKRFYSSHSFYSFDDLNKQMFVHMKRSNNIPMRPLHWKSPLEYLSVQYV